ncbi:MAG: hypothetical protein DRG24_06840 [Epsilonproteobacteria bacterium]|nr:MAG: hypothetical protein DRG24_06840 [Campylobacterota bacterium]
MKFNFKALISLGFGITSLMLLAYFYLLQRDFSSEYKGVVGEFHTLESSFGQLNYEILQSSLFAYHNQDEIAARVNRIEYSFKALKKSAILQQPQYKEVKALLESTNSAVEDYTGGINHYMMLNAGFKNSFVFLSTHAEESVELFPPHADIHTAIHHISDTFSLARRMLDADYLTTVSQQIDQLKKIDYNSDQIEFVDTFILHARFIANNFPDYIDSLNTLLQAQTELRISDAQKLFVKVAQADVKTLDQLAVILFIIIIGAMALITLLFFQSDRENIRLQRLQKELRHSLSHDQLTGLFNRFSLDVMLPKVEAPVLLLLNVDRFKHVNDFYGTQTGDAILGELASLIQLPMLDNYDPLFFHLGGDDFGIVLNGVDKKRAIQMAQIIATSIQSYPFIMDEIEIFITVAISVNSQAPYLENGDMALKHLKELHNENVICFDESMHLKEKARHNLATMRIIKTAIERNSVVPYFQPLYNLQTEKIEKYEALIRVELENGSLLYPDDFLGVASQTTYYRELTRIMLEKTLKRFQNLPYRFSVNLSMKDMMDESLVATLIKALEADRETAKRLDIELLESEELFDLERVILFIKQIKSYGCRIAIDDFGSGYSNFAYVAALPIDILKIDGSLIRTIHENPRNLQTVKTIIAFAKNLQLDIVAEYVEDEAMAQLLADLGVTYGQGYHFGKPTQTII